ncbi:hypothetical protein JL720_15032 [Aureococcus anophagefferens]|nr:hypothetical protein JL720_15032 [Aureococcus anophagefferens]
MHDGMGFLTQHVAVTNELELALQAVDASLALPFWDYTEDIARVRGGGGNTADLWSLLWTDDWYGNATHDDRHTVPHPEPRVLRHASPLDTWPSCEAHYNLTLSYDNWFDYVWTAGYAPHGPIHYFIGGFTHCGDLSAQFPMLDAEGLKSLALMQMEAGARDASFWSIHPTMERLLHYKMLADPFVTKEWKAYGDISMTSYCEYSTTTDCKGHALRPDGAQVHAATTAGDARTASAGVSAAKKSSRIAAAATASSMPAISGEYAQRRASLAAEALVPEHDGRRVAHEERRDVREARRERAAQAALLLGRKRFPQFSTTSSGRDA